MQKTDYEQWKKIGEQAKKTEEEMFKLLEELNEGNVPKSERDQWRRMKDAMTKFKSDMEGRMSEEHPPEVWDMSEFYPGSGEE